MRIPIMCQHTEGRAGSMIQLMPQETQNMNQLIHIPITCQHTEGRAGSVNQLMPQEV